MFKYFVSYSFGDGGLGFANAQVRLEKPIRGHEDIAVVTRLLSDSTHMPKIVVLNFCLFASDDA